jgi:hypothetical protein
MRSSTIRIKSDGALEQLDSLVTFVLLKQCDRKVRRGHRVARMLINRRTENHFGICKAASVAQIECTL